MIRILLLLVVVAVAAFFTNPKSEVHEAKARETLQAAAEADLENLNIGGAIGNSAAQLATGDYEDFKLLSRYSTPSVQDARVVCYGAFTSVTCSATAQSS